jgi:hypothetical protein
MTQPIRGGSGRTDLASYQPEEALACGVEPRAAVDRSSTPRSAPPAPESLPIERGKTSQGTLNYARLASPSPAGVGYSTGPREKRSCDLQDAPAGGEAVSGKSAGGLQSAGQSAQSLWDATQRAEYKSRIAPVSQQSLAQIQGLRQQAEQALKDKRPADAARYLDQARQIAQQANEERNAIRAAIQQKMSPVGRAVSRAIQEPRSWEALTRKYEKKTGIDLHETIAERAGTSRPSATIVAGAGAAISVSGLALGVRAAVRDISDAPLEQKPAVTLHHGAQMAGGAAGSTVGAVITAGLVGAVGLTGGVAGLAVIVGGALGGFSGSTVAGGVVPGPTEE